VEGISVGLFAQDLPEYGFPVKVSLLLERLAGSPVPLVTVDHPGKRFTMPYAVPKGSVLVLQVLNRVVTRFEVR
jgi:hypothetical protein